MTVLVLLACMYALLPLVRTPAPAAAQAASPDVAFAVEGVGAIDSASLERDLRPTVDTALDELESLFGPLSAWSLTITFGTAPDAITRFRWQHVGSVAWIDPAAGRAIVATDAYLNESPAERSNIVRNLLARQVLYGQTRGALPAGLNDGIAAYFERPILAEQARRGSLVQQLDASASVPNLTTIVNAAPSLLSADARSTLHYAFVAFLAEHYGVSALQGLVSASATATHWQAPLTIATGQTIDEIATAWDGFLPRWFNGGWQHNAINGFDTTMAQGLFDRGAYTSAIAMAEVSQALFAEIGDATRLAEIESFISLAAIGVRAEQLMMETQALLESHQYPEAASRLDDAEAQYAYLPAAHRPASLIATWRQSIDLGLRANADFDKANSLRETWSQTRQARDTAIRAADAYAALGDAEAAAQANDLASKLSLRLQRITLVAIAIVTMIAVWLLIWLWAWAPHRYLWTEPRHAIGSGAGD